MSWRGAQDVKIAIVIDPELPLGYLTNTVGAMAIGIGAALPSLGGVLLTDNRQFEIMNSADRPVPILKAKPEKMSELLRKLEDRPEEAIVVIFPAFARELHTFNDYEEIFPTRDLLNEKIDGIAIAGPTKWVKSVTGSFGLIR